MAVLGICTYKLTNYCSHLCDAKLNVNILRYDWYFSTILIQKLKSRWLQILKVFWTVLPVPLFSLNKQQHDPDCCQTRQAVSKAVKCCCSLSSCLFNFAWSILWRTPDRFFTLLCVCGNWWVLMPLLGLYLLQIRKRRPTPASLVIMNEHMPPGKCQHTF